MTDKAESQCGVVLQSPLSDGLSIDSREDMSGQKGTAASQPRTAIAPVARVPDAVDSAANPHDLHVSGAPTDCTDAEFLAAELRRQERARLAQLLHDSVIQDMTSLNLRLMRLAHRAPPEMASTLRQLATELAEQQRAIRTMFSD